MKQTEGKSLLFKWLHGTLSEDEKESLKALSNMDVLSRAIAMVDTFEMPEPDMEKIEQGLAQKRQYEKPKGLIRRFIMPLSAVAAILIALVFWFMFMSGTTVLQTQAQQQLTFTLPDQSTLILNALSEVSYSENDWTENRQLTLEGNAYFDVKKGHSFSVFTSLGNVQVLGTQFEVLSRGDIFEVSCYEGKVRLYSPGFDTTIVAGQGFVRQSAEQELFTVEDNRARWLEGELVFRKKQLAFVFDELERQYAVHIDYSAIRKTDRFTGTVPLDNLDVSLKIVCIAMGHQFSFSPDGHEVIISK